MKHTFGEDFGYFGVGSYCGSIKLATGADGKEKRAVPDGRGIWTAFGDVNGDCAYIGDWKDGKRHGFGVMRR